MSESDIRLLLIDDDDIDRMGVRRALKQAGVAFTAVEATDGNTGLHLLGQQQFDCVFCDYLLTDGDGLSLLKRVRAAGIEVPFIMLTGHGDERLAVEMMQARANDYLPKDQMTPEALAQALTHVLRLHKAEQERRAAERQLQESNRCIAEILESISDAFFALDRQRHFTYVNKQAECLLRLGRSQLLGKDIHSCLPTLSPWFYDTIGKAMSRKEPITNEGYDRDLGIWLEISVYPWQDGVSVYFRNISARKQAEERLQQLANFDSLTGLPNRALLMDRMHQALTRLPWQRRTVAVMFIDLDRFKIINDNLGHNVGDQLLREVANRLQECIRPGDTVARLGGDEFIVLLTDVAREEDVERIAQKIVDAVCRPLVLSGQEIHISASIGIALYSPESSTAEALLKNADVAMYKAKEQGKNNFQLYSPLMDSKSSRRFNLETALRQAVARNEFELHFQPVVEIASGRIVATEALLRWRYDDKLILPGDFLALAEETGLILPIGDWVLQKALTELATWHRAGHDHLRMAINLSNRQFRQPSLLSLIADRLAQADIPPAAVELELTEEIVMRDFERATAIIGELRALGVRLAIDDFGTGYSSLGRLRQFPIHTVKIDRSFIAELGNHAGDRAITEAIIAMAHKLRLEVIAEGVETFAQRNFLLQQGCEMMQGYFFSPPLPAAGFLALLNRHQPITG